MSRRGTGDDDETRNDDAEPRTEGLDLGADWLMSQLADTGSVPETSEPDSAADDDAASEDSDDTDAAGSAFRRRGRSSPADEPAPQPFFGDTDGFDIRPANLDSGKIERPLILPDDDDEGIDDAAPTRLIDLAGESRAAAAAEPAVPPADETDDDDEPWLLSAESDDDIDDDIDEAADDVPGPRSARPLDETQAFDVLADRRADDSAQADAETPKPRSAAVPSTAATPPAAAAPAVPPAGLTSDDGFFTWNLTPNDDEDPLVAEEAEPSQPEPRREPEHRYDPEPEPEPEPVADPTPTQAFDPFADTEPETEDPRIAALGAAFAAPGSFDRLYDEATLSTLDGDEAEDKPTLSAGPDLGIVDVLGRRYGAAGTPEPEAAEPEVTSEPVGPEAAEPIVAEPEAEAEPEPEHVGTERVSSAAPRDGIPDTLDEDVPDDADDTDERLRQLLGGTPVSASAASQGPAASDVDEDVHAESRQLPPPQVSPRRTIPESRPERRRLGASAPGPSRSAASPTPPQQRSGGRPALMIALALVAVLALGGLFWLGTLIPGMINAGQAEPTQTSTPTPTPSLPETGTLPAGTYAWDQLRGGECLDPYSSPWEETFTVVACDAEHAAQLITVGAVTDDENAEFPGQDELASQIYLLCSAPGVIDLAKAGEYGDVQVQGSYPVTEEQWNDGQRNYYCFVDRSSGEPMSGSLAGGEEG